MSSVVSPWHMWGSEEVIRVTPGVVAATPSRPITQQLGRVKYKRPESWRFVFFAEPLAPVVVPVGWADLYIRVNFNVAPGVGRSTWQSAGERVIGYDTLANEERFVQMSWHRTGGQSLTSARKWTSQAIIPQLDDDAVNPPVQTCDVIVGEDIQVSVSVSAVIVAPVAPIQDVNVRAGAFFAPNVHVRPDWSCESFVGDETGGR